MPFQKRNQFGRGRPKGSRNKLLALLDKRRDKALPKAMEHAATLAEGGDWPAIHFLLTHGYPAQRDRPVEVEVEPLEKPADVVKAGELILTAMLAGRITPQEAAAVLANVTSHRNNIQFNVHEVRLKEIEDMLHIRKQGDTDGHGQSADVRPSH